MAPTDFDIGKVIYDDKQLSKGFTPRDDALSYIARIVRQLELAMAANPASSNKKLEEWAFTAVEYQIVK